MAYSAEQIIEQTKKWIIEVVIGCNFCPFAAGVLRYKTVHYQVEENLTLDLCMTSVRKEVDRLDKNENIETSFLIFSNSFIDFNEYLIMVSQVDSFFEKNQYEGIYQVATFHPFYQFANSVETDAANYTNRSVYPMLHFLREESIEKALNLYENPENISKRNIDFAREKGPAYMKMLRNSCLTD